MTSLIVCPECALVQREPALPSGGDVRCSRCGALLYRLAPGARERRLPLLLAAAILFLIANVAPVVTMESGGSRTPATIIGTAASLWSQHRRTLAALVLTTTVLMPAFELGLGLLLLARARRPAVLGGAAVGLLHRVRRWSMSDVLVVATLVALARLASVARVEVGWGLWALLALTALRGVLPTDADLDATAAPASRMPARTS